MTGMKELMKTLISLALLSLAAPLLAQAGRPAYTDKQVQELKDTWKPAPAPKGGIGWQVLESTKETTRRADDGYIRSKPVFPPAVKALNGKRVKVAGFMMPLENSSKQKHFVLMAYPPGCPFHTHAMPNQFIEIFADSAFPVEIEQAIIVEGVLELTGMDESGVFYRMKAAKPG